MKKRYLINNILEDLDVKMVFLGGPRQVGKTTLSQKIAQDHFKKSSYLNWDFRDDRRNILDYRFASGAEILIFDEIHKYQDWKNYLKGLFDKHKTDFKILATGSARLDFYRKGGDSLMGRYHYYRLHPFSLCEMLNKKYEFSNKITKELNFPEASQNSSDLFKTLFKFGGFPEPLFSQEEKTLRRWHHEKVDRLVREDIRDVENIRNLSALQILVDILPSRVASLLSLNSLREDLAVSHKTVSAWMDILERFYYHFRIYPFRSNKIKSLKKEPKLYLWDWSEIEDNEAAKLENIIASHLLKFCHFLVDSQGHKAELYYLRDVEGHEVDFLVTINQEPWFAVEVKSTGKNIAKHLQYFGKRLKIPFLYQVVKDPNVDFSKNDIRVISADKFLQALI